MRANNSMYNFSGSWHVKREGTEKCIYMNSTFFLITRFTSHFEIDQTTFQKKTMKKLSILFF